MTLLRYRGVACLFGSVVSATFCAKKLNKKEPARTNCFCEDVQLIHAYITICLSIYLAVVDNETRGKARGRSLVNLLSLLGVYANAEKVLLTHAPSWKRAQCEDVVKAIAAKDVDAAQSAAARPAPASQEEATRTKVRQKYAATCSHSRHRDEEVSNSIPKPRKNEDCKDLPLARRAFPVRLRVLALDEQIAVYTRRGDRAFVVDDLQRSTPAANKPHHELEPPARTVRLPSWRRRMKS